MVGNKLFSVAMAIHKGVHKGVNVSLTYTGADLAGRQRGWGGGGEMGVGWGAWTVELKLNRKQRKKMDSNYTGRGCDPLNPPLDPPLHVGV